MATMDKKDRKMNQQFKDDWPFFEKILASLRYLKIRKYIDSVSHPICVDIGCGFHGGFLRRIENRIGGGGGTALILEQMRLNMERSEL